MSTQLSPKAYAELIEEDIQALENSNCSKLEKEHIIQVLRKAVSSYCSNNKKPVVIVGKTNDEIIEKLKDFEANIYREPMDIKIYPYEEIPPATQRDDYKTGKQKRRERRKLERKNKY